MVRRALAGMMVVFEWSRFESQGGKEDILIKDQYEGNLIEMLGYNYTYSIELVMISNGNIMRKRKKNLFLNKIYVFCISVTLCAV